MKILYCKLKTYIKLLVQKLYSAAKRRVLPSTSPSQYCEFGLFQCFISCFKCFVTSFIAMYSPACNNYISHGKWNGMNLHPTMGFLTFIHQFVVFQLLHRGALCQFPFRWNYYYGSNKSTWKETGKTHLVRWSVPVYLKN